MKRWILASAVAVTLVVTLGVTAFASIGRSACTPEARDAAISRDVKLMLSGAISYQEGIDREAERIAACDG